MDGNIENHLAERVIEAARSQTVLAICGGETKSFLGREAEGEKILTTEHSGIVNYQPTELVLTARAGTPIEAINEALLEHNQMLGFDPPLFSSGSTLGGAIASGLSGPSRAFTGSVQDFVLGTKILSGRGEVLNFGGRVIKNVAGFDISRLMAGSMGCLGILLEVSLKVIPVPELVVSVAFDDSDSQRGIERMNDFAGRPNPVSAAAWVDGKTYIRLSGSETGVFAAKKEIGGYEIENSIWESIRDQSHSFFNASKLCIKAIVPSSAMPFSTGLDQLIDWGGGCRWICTEQWSDDFSNGSRAVGGHCTIFRNGDRAGEVFPLPDPAFMKIQQNLKLAFDPERILNPGRMYSEL